MKKLQIGIIGSMADKEQSTKNIELSKKIGRLLARKNVTLMFGFEGDFSSLSQIAAKEASDHKGSTVAFLWGKDQKFDLKIPNCTIISTGQIRGGGRELALVLSCDALIAISGGSGTLTEICFAYQADVPIITLKNTGGWSNKLADQFLDERKRGKIHGVTTAEEAVRLAIQLAGGGKI